MIPIQSPAVYATALKTLKNVVGQKFRGRAAQIFLACKQYGNQIPRVGSAVGIDTRQLQQLLDELYIKPARTTPEKIAIIFDDDHKVPSGQIAGALKSPSNIWRNNLNLQKGFICYASVAEMQNPSFVTSSRKLCPHLRPSGTTTLNKSWCGVVGAPPPRYRNEDNPKMFRKDPVTEEYMVHDPTDVAFYSNIMRPPTGLRIPIAPLIVALYHDSFLAAGRTHVDVPDFVSDFGFTATEIAAYFDDDPASAAHQTFGATHPGITWTMQAAAPVTTPTPTLPGASPALVPKKATKKNKPLLHPATIVVTSSPPPPTVSGWWDAQQAVRKTLELAGWTVLDVSGMQLGCDFQITKGATTKLIEVKSSVGICTAKLTRLEYAQALSRRHDFVLAIVENFDPKGAATIQWVEDPVRLQLTKRLVEEYTLPRSIWKKHTSPMP